jgi:hypothetical protein
MTQASYIAAEIEAKLPSIKGGSLAVWGDIFGGRVDNWHVVISAEAVVESDLVLIRFNHGETLQVWAPQDATVGADDFRIVQATRVRWEWFYYGRPETPENRNYIEHALVGGNVVATTDATWAPPRFAPSLARPAVEILGFD